MLVFLSGLRRIVVELNDLYSFSRVKQSKQLAHIFHEHKVAIAEQNYLLPQKSAYDRG